MGFKLKHVFKGPAKVLNKVGKSGVFGKRNGHFRILGIKIGKDLAKVVQAAVITAAVASGGPALASGVGVSASTGNAIVGTAAKATLTGLNGGNESDMAKEVTNTVSPVLKQAVKKTVTKVAIRKMRR